MSLAGPTLWSEATGRSDVTGHWCAARLPFAGGITRCKRTQTTRHSLLSPKRHPRRGKKTGPVEALPCWPRLLRAVRAWLTPAHWLARCWAACANARPPAELAALLGALNAGHGINLYLRI